MTLLYEDADMLVVNKPAGVSVIPAPGVSPGACLRDHVAALTGTRLWVVHRLDRDTSGALAFARTPDAHRRLSMAFEHRDVLKCYTAFVRGIPDPPAGDIAQPLHEARKGKMRPAQIGEPGAREARTAYEVVRVWGAGASALAEVRLRPLTGRRHQLRVHLRAIGTPILGDTVYGPAHPGSSAMPVARLALHAASLDVPHPRDGHRVVIDAPEPDDLLGLRAWLDGVGAHEARA